MVLMLPVLSSCMLSHVNFIPPHTIHDKQAMFSQVFCFMLKEDFHRKWRRTILQSFNITLSLCLQLLMLSFGMKGFIGSAFASEDKVWRARSTRCWRAWVLGETSPFGWGLELSLPTWFLVLTGLHTVTEVKPENTHKGARRQASSNKC